MLAFVMRYSVASEEGEEVLAFVMRYSVHLLSAISAA